jgi:hypothetical protein
MKKTLFSLVAIAILAFGFLGNVQGSNVQAVDKPVNSPILPPY